MRKVLIGIPMMDGKAAAQCLDSLIRTLLAQPPGVSVDYLFVTLDSLVQRARNDIFAVAVRAGVDDLVCIDADQAWEPAWFYALLAHPVDVVGMTYPKKSDTEAYPVNCSSRAPVVGANGLILVDGLGLGFVRFSKKALLHAWDRSTPYRENGIDKRMVFNLVVENGELVSEDISACKSLKELGVYLDPRYTLPHVGVKVYTGNFSLWLSHLLAFERGRQAGAAALAPGTVVPPAALSAPSAPGVTAPNVVPLVPLPGAPGATVPVRPGVTT